MPELFIKARQSRIFQDVVEQIQAAILGGGIAPGDKLPPERELVDVFGTSRPTVREALRVLEQKGLIEIRLGVRGGAYVRTPNSELMAENLAMLIRTESVSLAHLAEFRQGIEGLVAGLAALRATANDIEILNELVADSIHLNIHRYFDKFLRVGGNELEENYRDLAQLAAAIEAHDSGLASRLARQHIQRFNSYMEKKVRLTR